MGPRQAIVTVIVAGAVLLSSAARAEDEAAAPNSRPSPRPRTESGISGPLMVGGAVVFATGYLLSVVAAVTCESDCIGVGKQAIPFAGRALYLSDSDRHAALAAEEERQQRMAARGDGCANSSLGCGPLLPGLTDFISVVAWIPTVLQIAGASMVVVGAVASPAGGNAAPRATSTWTPKVTSLPGGAALGIGGTF